MASAAGVAPAASAFAGRCSDLSELRGQLALGHLASVIGLAPIRPGVRGRLREWWPCANSFAFKDYLRRANKWSPRLVSRQRLLGFSEALICLSYSGKWSSGAATLRGLPLSGGRSAFELQDARENGGWCRNRTHAAVQAHSVFGTGALLLCQPSEMVRVAGVAPATSWFRTRPSAADITP